jgi:hypothetical protein
VFPSCSHKVPQVPKLFPQDIPNCNSILSHIIITLQNFIYKTHHRLEKCTKSNKNKGEFKGRSVKLAQTRRCQKFNSHVYKLKKVGHRKAHLFLFWDLGSKEEVLLLGGEHPMFQKNWWCTNQYGSFQKKKEKKEKWVHPWTNY